jgi:hypothetical protein
MGAPLSASRLGGPVHPAIQRPLHVGSLLFLRQVKGGRLRQAFTQALGATLWHGAYSTVAPFTLPAGITESAVSADSALMYDPTTGYAESGTFVNGIYKRKSVYRFAPGWNQVVASCDSAFLYNRSTGIAAWGLLKNGLYAQTGSEDLDTIYANAPLPVAQRPALFAASCHSLAGESPILPPGWPGPSGVFFAGFSGGTLDVIGFSGADPMTRLVATETSFYFTTGHTGNWADIPYGMWNQCTDAGAAPPPSLKIVAAAGDSLLFYQPKGFRGGKARATFKMLTNCSLTDAGSVGGLENDWTTITGGK